MKNNTKFIPIFQGWRILLLRFVDTPLPALNYHTFIKSTHGINSI